MEDQIREVETNSGTVKSAADRIKSLMDGQPPEEDATHPDPEATSEAEEPKQQQAEEQEPESSEMEEPTEDESEPVTHFNELADHLGVEEDFLESLIVPTKVNGEERSATIKDLIATYQKSESADLKLMNLAEQRKAFDAETAKANEALQQEWSRVQAMNTELQNMLSGDDEAQLSELRHTDPAEYAARMADRQQRLQKAQKVQTEMAKMQQEKVLTEYQHRVNSERQRLLQALPDWADEKTAERENVELRSYLKSSGLEDWEIDGKFENGMLVHPGIIDHRAIVLARKAMLYDRSRQGTEPKKTKLKTLPKVGSGKRKSKGDVQVEQIQEVRGRLRKTGTLQDAALAIKQMMEN